MLVVIRLYIAAFLQSVWLASGAVVASMEVPRGRKEWALLGWKSWILALLSSVQEDGG